MQHLVLLIRFFKDNMITYTESANDHINDIAIETEALRQSFAKTIKDFGPNSYKPFAVFFSDPETKSFILTSRPIQDEQDYYTSISEMLFAYSSFESQAILFALDASKEINSELHDVFEIYMACDDYCFIYSYPYSLDSNNEIQWYEDLFKTSEIQKLDQAYDTGSSITATMEIIEALYLHVHLESQFFDPAKIKSFFDFNNFEYVDLTKDSEKNNSLVL